MHPGNHQGTARGPSQHRQDARHEQKCGDQAGIPFPSDIVARLRAPPKTQGIFHGCEIAVRYDERRQSHLSFGPHEPEGYPSVEGEQATEDPLPCNLDQTGRDRQRVHLDQQLQGSEDIRCVTTVASNHGAHGHFSEVEPD